jgi:hypothetical protein
MERMMMSEIEGRALRKGRLRSAAKGFLGVKDEVKASSLSPPVAEF